MSILVTRSSMPPIDEYVEEIGSIFENRRLTNMGPEYKKFQHQLKEYLDVPELSLFVNGHMALEMAIHALGSSMCRKLQTPMAARNSSSFAFPPTLTVSSFP